MKKLFTVALCAIVSVLAMAQTHNMQIKLKSGEVVTYKTTDVDNIKFEEENTPTPPPSGAFEVEFYLQELTSTSCKVKITPSDETKYYAHIWQREFMLNPNGGLLSDMDILKTCVPDPRYDERCYTGETVLSEDKCVPGSQFLVVVFDAKAKVDNAGQEILPVPVYTYGIKLTEGLNDEPQFELSEQVIGYEDVRFHAKAKDPNGFLSARIVPKPYFDKHGETVMQSLYYMYQNASVEKNISFSEYVKQNGAYGECDFYFDHLVPNTEYVVAVFYMDPENDDVINVYDWNYTRWDFTTKAATTKPTLELTNAKKTRNADGTINISVHAKATNAVKAVIGARSATEVASFSDINDVTQVSDLWVGMKWLTSSQVEQLNTPEGYDIYIQGMDDINNECCFLMRVKDAQGGTATCAAVLEW